MTVVEYIGATLGLVIAAYAVIRVATAAYYQSKKDYERSKSNGPK